MNILAPNATVPRARGRTRPATVVATALLAVSMGLAIAFAFAGAAQPSSKLVLAGGIAGIAILALALARYEAAAALGMLIFGVVFVQPAPTDVVLMIVIAVAVVTGRFTLRRIPFPLLALVCIFLTLNLVSAVFAVSPSRVGFFFLTTLYLCAFAVWITGFVDSEHRAAVIIRPLVAGAVASTAIGVAVLYVNFPGRSIVDFSDGLRARGFFKDPNVFGPFCVFVALIVISELLEPRLLRARRPTKLVLLAVLALGVIFASSRAAWLNAAVATTTMVVAYGLRRGGGRKAAAILVTLVVLAGVGTLVLAASGSAAFLGSRAHYQTYDNTRFAAQEEGLRLVQHYPFGIGPGQFELDVPIAAHSTYVRVLAEQGFLGLFVMIALLLATLGLATGNVITGRDTFGIGSVPLLAAMCGTLANSAFVDTLHWRHAWLLFGLIWAGAMRPSDELLIRR